MSASRVLELEVPKPVGGAQGLQARNDNDDSPAGY